MCLCLDERFANSCCYLFVIGGSQLNARGLWSTKSNSFGKTPKLMIQKKSTRAGSDRKLSVRAEYKYVISTPHSMGASLFTFLRIIMYWVGKLFFSRAVVAT